MIPDYYKILGISPAATQNEIKKAYRILALKYHPDVCKEAGAHERFVKINEAYLILSDEKARKKYDEEYSRVYADGVNSEENTYPGKFDDPDLNDWAQTAHEQGEHYANIRFAEFASLVKQIVIETGNQLRNSFVYMVGLFLGVQGIFTALYGLFHLTTNPFLFVLGLIFGVIGVVILKKAI